MRTVDGFFLPVIKLTTISREFCHFCSNQTGINKHLLAMLRGSGIVSIKRMSVFSPSLNVCV